MRAARSSPVAFLHAMAKDLVASFDPDDALDADAKRALNRALADVDDGAFTYLTFREAVRRLRASGQDAETALQSVFLTAEAMGVDRKRLRGSAKAYVKALEKERGLFTAAMDKRLTEGVAADEARIEKLAQQLSKLEEQRAQLEEKLAIGREKKASLEAELESVRQRVQERGRRFDEAYEALKAQMMDDLSSLG